MIRRIPADQMASTTSTTDPVLWLPNGERRHLEWQSSLSNRNPSGVRITPENSLQCTVVLACTRVLAEAVASLRLNVYKQDGDRKTIEASNPLNRLISMQPNRWQTSYEWLELMMFNLCIYGNAYNLITRGARGVVTSLTPMHPSRMMVEEVTPGVLRYTYSESNGAATTYPAEDIMHVRWLSTDSIVGVVPTQISKDAIALARACEIHGSTYFGNGARPGVILETENEITADAALALRENWERIHQGVHKAWRTAVLTNGLKAHELGTNNQESQYLEVRRFQTEEICRVYRVAPHLVMDLQRATFSNIESQSLDFLQYTLTPWLRRIEQAIGRDVLGYDDDLRAEFDIKSFMRGDATSRASYYSAMFNLGVLSINEIRAAENLNPIPGGDKRFVQLNMSELNETTGVPENVGNEEETTPSESP